MQAKYLEQQFAYTGDQLHSLFAYLEHGVLGDSIVAWVGPCQVGFEHMVDGEDLLAQSPICGDQMLHFIVEKFDISLFCGVSLQRMLTTLAIEALRALSPNQQKAQQVIRRGDDIYYLEHKLSISIATQSPVSTLIHFAVNLSNEGTPVQTCALVDFEVEAQVFAKKLMSAFVAEVEDMLNASRKVKWVR